MLARRHNILHYLFVIFENLFKSLAVSLVWLVVAAIGYWIFIRSSLVVGWVVGVPLILIGGGLMINSLSTVIQTIFSPTYNKGVCRICSRGE